MKDPPSSYYLHPLLVISVFFFLGKFSQPGDQKKKGLANPTKRFLSFKKKMRHILTKKKLRSRQI